MNKFISSTNRYYDENISGNLASYDPTTDSLTCNFPIMISKILHVFTPNKLLCAENRKQTKLKKEIFYYDLFLLKL